MSVWLAFGGLALTMLLAYGNLAYRLGHGAARVEELEKWRGNMRADMHEISDKLSAQTTAIQSLTTLIDERTERRQLTR
jgi:hypothetical protein